MTPIRWRPLCEPETFPRLVLDPQVAGEAERRGERRLARHRRDAEAAPVDRLKTQVEFADQVGPGGVGEADGARQPVGRQPLPVAQERVVFVAFGEVARLRRRRPAHGRRRRPARRRWDRRTERRASDRRRRRSRGRRTAASVVESHDSLAAAPLSALNFVIIASHAGARSSRPSQNAWRERAWKSSSDTPCCSTQVK